MTAAFAGAAILLGAAGSALLYLVAPHQRLLARRPPKRFGLWVGGLALLASLVLLRQVMGPASSVFATLTLAMAVFTGLPFLAMILGHRERR